MNLHISNEDELGLDGFCNWLIQQMQIYMQSNIDERQLARFDAFIFNNQILKTTDKTDRYISCKSILIGSTYNLIVEKTANDYTICINPNINIPNTYNKFSDIISLIDSGNLSLPSYPIYSTMMEFFAKDLQLYYEEYIRSEEK